MAAEVVPYVVGAVVTVLVLRWLFNDSRDDTPNTGTRSPSLYFTPIPAVDDDSVAELRAMFPFIPVHVVRRELGRARGNTATAIDSLLLINPDFPGNSASADLFSTDANEPKTSNRVMKTHREIVQELSKADMDELASKVKETPALSRKEWDAVDSTTRQKILMERKAQMILEARKRFVTKIDRMND